MSIALIVTHGFGNGTLTGSIKDVVTDGYTIGAALATWTVQTNDATTWTEETDDTTTWTVQPNDT